MAAALAGNGSVLVPLFASQPPSGGIGASGKSHHLSVVPVISASTGIFSFAILPVLSHSETIDCCFAPKATMSAFGVSPATFSSAHCSFRAVCFRSSSADCSIAVWWPPAIENSNAVEFTSAML